MCLISKEVQQFSCILWFFATQHLLYFRLEEYIQEMNRADDHRNDKVLKFLKEIANKLKVIFFLQCILNLRRMSIYALLSGKTSGTLLI